MPSTACWRANYDIQEKEKLAKGIKFVSWAFWQIVDNGELYKNKLFIDLTQMFEWQVVWHSNYVKKLYNFVDLDKATMAQIDKEIALAKSEAAKQWKTYVNTFTKDVVDLRVKAAQEQEFTKRIAAINKWRKLNGLELARRWDEQPKYIQELAQSMKNMQSQLTDSAARLKNSWVDITPFLNDAIDWIENYFRIDDKVNDHLRRQYGSSFYDKAGRLNPELKTFLEQWSTFWLDEVDMSVLRYILWDDSNIWQYTKLDGVRKWIVTIGKYKKATSLFNVWQFITQWIQYAAEVQWRTKTLKWLSWTKEDIEDLLSLMYNNWLVSDSANLISNVWEWSTKQLEWFLKNMWLVNVENYLTWKAGWIEWLWQALAAYFDWMKNLSVGNTWDIIEIRFDPILKWIAIQEAAISRYGSVSNFRSVFRKASPEEQKAMMKEVADAANTTFIPNLKWFIADKYAMNRPTSWVWVLYSMFSYMSNRWQSLMKRTLWDNVYTVYMMFNPATRKEWFQRMAEWFLPTVESIINSTYYYAKANRVDREVWNKQEKDKSLLDQITTYWTELWQFSSRAAATQANFLGRTMLEWLKRRWDQDVWYQLMSRVAGEFWRQLWVLNIPIDILDALLYSLSWEKDSNKIQDTVFERRKWAAYRTFASAVPYAINQQAEENDSILWYTAYKQGNVWLLQSLWQISSYKSWIERLSELSRYAKYKDISENGSRLDWFAQLTWRNAISKIIKNVDKFLIDAKYKPYQERADETLLQLINDDVFRWLINGESSIYDMAKVMQKVSWNEDKWNKKLIEAADVILDSDYHKFRENDAKWKWVTMSAENLWRATIKDWFGEKGEFNYPEFIKFLQNTSSDDIQRLWFVAAQLWSDAPWAHTAMLSYLTEKLKKWIGNGDIMFFPEDWTFNGVKVKKWQLVSEKVFWLSKWWHRIVSNWDGTFSVDKFKKSDTPADLSAEAKLALANNILPLLKTVNRPAYNTVLWMYADAKWVQLNWNLLQFMTAYTDQLEATYNWKTPDFARLNEVTTALGSIYRQNKTGKALSEWEKDQQAKDIASLKLSVFADISDFVKSSPLDDDSKASTLIQVFKSNEDIITEVLENPDKYKDYKDIATKAAWELYGNNAFIEDRAKADIASELDKAMWGSGWWKKWKAPKVAKIKDIDIASAIKFNNNYHPLLSNAAKNKIKEAGSVFTNADRIESDFLRWTARWAVSAISTDRYTVKWGGSNIRQLSIPWWKGASSSAKRKSSKKTSRKIVLY